ncbi:hypothetical protein HYALB_00011577 [Hymenoscyphus albidus]|uniref:Uncharacterized protein n=1 Tax=Hymenoscyphus albidus TaxID=595503 RepID=A0A9N9Q978_9HELO|nr:hypothetical protein HYALB_00011577 [Hymenoscyphus albidus]
MYKWSSLHRAVHRPLVLQHHHLLTKHKTNLFSSTTQNLQTLPDPTSSSKILPSEEQKEQERENATPTSSFSCWINRARSKASRWKEVLVGNTPRTSISSSFSSATENLDESHSIPTQQPASGVDSPEEQLLIRRPTGLQDAYNRMSHYMNRDETTSIQERKIMGALKHSASTFEILKERMEKMEATIQSLQEKLYSEVEERLRLEKNMIQFKLDSSIRLRSSLPRHMPKEYVSNHLAYEAKTDRTLVREGMEFEVRRSASRGRSQRLFEMMQCRGDNGSRQGSKVEAQWLEETQASKWTQTPQKTQTPRETHILKWTQAPKWTPTPQKTQTPRETKTSTETQAPKGDWESIRTAFHQSLAQQQDPSSIKIKRVVSPLRDSRRFLGRFS